MFDIVNPRQVVLVTCRGKASQLGKEIIKDNIITLSWHSPLSFDPEMYGISVGKNRFSYGLIKESKVFTVNFMPYDLKEKVLMCGMISGSSVDKFQKSGLSSEECESIDCCRISDACSYLECEVIEEVDTGDHVFFIGKIIKKILKDSRKRVLYLGSEKFSTTI